MPPLSEQQLSEDIRTVRVRRALPRPPGASTALIITGAAIMLLSIPMICFAAGRGLWGALNVNTLAGVPAAVGAAVILAGRAVRRRFRRKMRATDGLYCINCYQRLQPEPPSGFCPECREPYDIAEVKRSWQYWGGGFF